MARLYKGFGVSSMSKTFSRAFIVQALVEDRIPEEKLAVLPNYWFVNSFTQDWIPTLGWKSGCISDLFPFWMFAAAMPNSAAAFYGVLGSCAVKSKNLIFYLVILKL